MSVDAQSGTIYQNTHHTMKVEIPIGSSGYTHADVSAATMKWSNGASNVISKSLAGATLTATTVGTNIVLTVALVPADTVSLVLGTYDVQWAATIDGIDDVRATGVVTLKKRS